MSEVETMILIRNKFTAYQSKADGTRPKFSAQVSGTTNLGGE